MGKSAQRRHERMMMQRTDAQLAEQRALREESEQATATAKKEYREFEFENPFEDLTDRESKWFLALKLVELVQCMALN